MTTSPAISPAQLAALRAVSAKLASQDGDSLRACIQQLVELAGATGGSPDDERALQARSQDALNRLATAIEHVLDRPLSTGIQWQTGEVTALVDQLRGLATAIQNPSGETSARLRALFASVSDNPMTARDSQLAALVNGAARAAGLTGDLLSTVTERAQLALRVRWRQLELAAQQDASRAQTAAQLDALLASAIACGGELGGALADQRAVIARAFGQVGLDRMAAGLRVLAAWLTAPTHDRDPAARVAQLRAQLATALGPPSMEAPAGSERERQARLEREASAAATQAVQAALTAS